MYLTRLEVAVQPGRTPDHEEFFRKIEKAAGDDWEEIARQIGLA